MKSLVFLAAGIVFGSAAMSAPLPDPIAPAAKGLLQCYQPDKSHKTCSSLAGYKSAAGGTIDNTAVILISRSPLITMQTVSPVEVRSGRVCGSLRDRDIDEAKFSDGAHPLEARKAELLRQQLKVALKDLLNHEICTTYVPDGDGFLAKETKEGVPMPGTDQHVIWVSPRDGYRVSP
jgi:hypothetical protein